MKKMIAIISVLALTVVLIPSIGEANAQTNVDVSVYTDENIDAYVTLQGEYVSLVIDGVPVKEKFDNIDMAINYLADWNSAQDDGIDKNSKKYNNLKNSLNTFKDKVDEELEKQEEKDDALLNNTVYNKNRYDEFVADYNMDKQALEGDIDNLEFWITVEQKKRNTLEDWTKNRFEELEEENESLGFRNNLLSLLIIIIVVGFSVALYKKG